LAKYTSYGQSPLEQYHKIGKNNYWLVPTQLSLLQNFEAYLQAMMQLMAQALCKKILHMYKYT
jgi:hypothetical protein